MRHRAVGGTHPGSREHNEDAVLRLSRIPLYAVADGMGGPGAGDVAAQLALQVLNKYGGEVRTYNRRVAEERTTQNRLALSTKLDQVFNEGSKEIAQEAARLGVPGMGCTLVMATVIDNFAYVAHVGDARAYLIREGRALRLTEDHSVAEFRFRRGKITREEYESTKERRVLYQALGTGAEVDVDLAEVRLADKDVLLLTSDGLMRVLSDEDLPRYIDREDLNGSVERLIQAANQDGAPDNLSAVLLAMHAEDGDEPIQAVTDLMGRIFLFSRLSEPERLVIAPYLEEVEYDAGDTILDAGDPGDHFHVVIQGQVCLERDGIRLGDIPEGGHFGELSLARHMRRASAVRAVTDVRLLSLSRERFHEVVRHKPDLGAALSLSLLEAVGDRVRDLTERMHAVERAVRGELRYTLARD